MPEEVLGRDLAVGDRNTGRDAYFFDPEAVKIADAVVGTRDPRLIRWVKESLLADTQGQVENEFRPGTAPEVIDAARVISAAGAVIIAKGPGVRGNLVGAVVERMAWLLVNSRTGTADRERKVDLGGGQRSEHIEVIVDDEPFEAYECKRDPQGLDQNDLDQLAAIRRAAVTRGREASVGVVTLENWRTLERALTGLTVPTKLYHVCQADFLELGDAPAWRALQRNMAANHS